ncbi:MAG: pantetheine-phosphate adenylyltransferase, partial [Roseiflexaceae bacterium]|nr:pantetheine-phosphate adenylyltransferase [Roseiflexaceae bacterium]
MTIAIYPGSFDPVTNGHLDIAARAARLFDSVVMAVFDRPSKRLLFSTEQRIALLREATQNMPQVRVDSYTSLTVDYARSVGASVMVRGLRAVSDFEHEFQLSQINHTLAPEIEFVTFMADQKYTFFSSSTVREIASLNGDVTWLVPAHVVLALKQVYGHNE